VAAQPLERSLAAICPAEGLSGRQRGADRNPSWPHFQHAGDSVIADFASAVEAVACAVAVQNTVATEDPDSVAGEPTRFRIGVDVGS
jgi:hypothetical protein